MLLPALALLVAGLRLKLGWTWLLIALVVAGGMLVRSQMWIEHVGPGRSFDYFKYIYYSTLCRFDELVAGVALALVRNYHAPLWQRLTAHGNLALAAGVAVSALAFWIFLGRRYGLYQNVFGFPLLALGFGLLILSALSERSILRSLRVPGAGPLALWSYALYLTHKQVCILAREPLERLGYGPESPLAIAVMLAMSVLSGWLLYRLVEMPFMALRQRWVPSNFAPAAKPQS